MVDFNTIGSKSTFPFNPPRTREERIVLTDNIKGAAIKLSEGNIGAASVLVRLVQKSEEVEPDATMGPLTNLFILDSFGIYGSRIWQLYMDVCKEDIATTIAVLRACQLGIISEDVLNHAIDNRGQGLDLNDTILKVKESVPNFNIEV